MASGVAKQLRYFPRMVMYEVVKEPEALSPGRGNQEEQSGVRVCLVMMIRATPVFARFPRQICFSPHGGVLFGCPAVCCGSSI